MTRHAIPRGVWLSWLVHLISGLLLTGCVGNTPQTAAEQHQRYRYDRVDLDELLAFGSELAERNDEELDNVCHELNQLEDNPVMAGSGLLLHRMVGRLYSEKCGDLKSLVKRLDSFSLESLPDWRTRQLVVMQASILRRKLPLTLSPKLVKLKTKTRKTTAGGRKRTGKHENTAMSLHRSIPVNALAQPHPHSSAPVKSSDDRLLKNKLEAIRAMEKQLDAVEGGP